MPLVSDSFVELDSLLPAVQEDPREPHPCHLPLDLGEENGADSSPSMFLRYDQVVDVEMTPPRERLEDPSACDGDQRAVEEGSEGGVPELRPQRRERPQDLLLRAVAAKRVEETRRCRVLLLFHSSNQHERFLVRERLGPPSAERTLPEGVAPAPHDIL